MLTGFEVRAALTVNHTKDFNEDVETVPRRWLNNLINLVGHRQGEIANSFLAYNCYLHPLNFGRWYLPLSLSFHRKSEEEPPEPVPTCGVGIPPAAI